MPKVFISHSWEDNEIARKLEENLRWGGAEVLIDFSRIEAGESLSLTISKAIDWCDILLLLWSQSALNSYWVTEEWTCAHSLKKRIIPCLLDSTKLPSLLMSKYYINFNEFDQGYSSLAKALKLTINVQKNIPKKIRKTKISRKLEFAKGQITIMPSIIFRSNPQVLSRDDVIEMIKKHDFFDSSYNRNGNGFDKEFEQQNIKDERIIFDKASWLMWQQSGSDEYMLFEDAENWINKLNEKCFAGFSDWRLPTLEESMSLIEPIKKNSDLFIDSIFDKSQRYIWTSDKVKDESWTWVVDFHGGFCSDHHFSLRNIHYVRAVRSTQSSSE